MRPPATRSTDDSALDVEAEARARALSARRALSLVRRARGGARGRGRLAAGLAIVAAFYAVAALADFIAPYDYRVQSRNETFAPASVVHFYDESGNFHVRPFIRASRLTDQLAHAYTEDNARRYPLTLFPRGYAYNFLGLFKTDRHLFGVAAENSDQPPSHQTSPVQSPSLSTSTSSSPTASTSSSSSSSSTSTASPPSQTSSPVRVPLVHLLGTDRLGRDRFSQLFISARFSLFVAPLGTILAGALGILIGCVAGYAGRKTDAVLMRAADAMMSLPALVLILAARAALPDALPRARVAAFLVAVFVVVGWAEMARLVRGLVLELRAREFVTAARSIGMTESRVLFRHILPNATRAVVVQLSLMLPAFLLAETALSFLGIGVPEPEVSWGTMLIEAKDLSQIGEQPLLLLAPAIAIFLFVLGVRLASDGLRRTDGGD